jgi:hypothetical protein
MPERLVAKLATTFPNADTLRKQTCFHVAIAAPLLAQIGRLGREEVHSNYFEQDSLHQKITRGEKAEVGQTSVTSSLKARTPLTKNSASAQFNGIFKR